MRYRRCKYCGELHALNAWPDNHRDQPWPRSDHPAPYIQSDSLPGYAMQSMADGKMYTSKGKYYGGVKDAGCEIVGNDRPAGYRPPDNFLSQKRYEQIAAEGLKRYEQETGRYETQIDQTYRIEP